MPGIEKKLDVPWFRQQTLFFCGPAVAQMFLEFVKVTVPQAALWSDIKNNTVGTRPVDALMGDHDFPQQVCDDCDPNSNDPRRWKCWDATPEALSATVSARNNIALEARYASTFDEGVEMLIESLDRTPEVPPFATIQLINHWVVVRGYVRDDFQSTATPVQAVGRYNLNLLYIHDPQDLDGENVIRMVSVTDWRSKFGLIDCGSRTDTYPVVVAGAQRLAPWVRVAALLLGWVSFCFIWKWFRHRRPTIGK